MTRSRMHRLRLTLGVVLMVSTAAPAAGQSAGPYVAGFGGATGGDGGGAPLAGIAAGYMTPQRLGFELEIAVNPSLQFDDWNFPRILGDPARSIYPVPMFSATGRLLTLHTNAVFTIVEAGKLRAAVIGGGGMANLRRDISYSTFTFIALPVVNPGLALPNFELVERRAAQTDNALSLNVGGIVDYGVTGRLRLGVDARYTHAFFAREGWQGARVAARAQWRF